MRWTPTSVEEMRAFFGCLIYMGLCQLSDIRNYWSEALGQERISSVFSRNRFTDLFRYLHCNDNTMALSKNDPNHDKLHKLAKELQLGQPWMLFFDNFFSSVDLIDQLFERGKLATATIRPNRAGLPIEVKNAKLETGEMIWRMKDPQTVVTKWKDTKEVLLISSMSRAVPSETDFVTKSQKGTAEKTTRTFSLCVIQYRKRMGGVDTNDQMIAYQNLSRKSYRWWVPIFLDLFKQAIVNAWILEQYQPDAKKRGQKEFRIELFQSLVGTFSARKREAGQQPNATKRFDGNQHFFVKSEKRGFCKNVCGSKVFYKCTKCEIFLCIVCFYNYHKRL
eukprot:gene5786-11074_t